MAKKCKNCGCTLQKDSQFCIHCGHPVSAPKTKKIRKPLPAGMRILLTCICCIILVLLGCLASLGLSVRHLTSPEQVRTAIENLDISDIKTGFLSGNGRKEKVPDLIYNCLPDYLHYHCDEDQIEVILNEDFTKDFVSVLVSRYIDDIFKNTGDGLIEADDIEDYFDENLDEIQDILEYEIPNWAIVDLLDDLDNENIEKITDLSEYRNQHQSTFTALRIAFSYPVLIISTILCIVFVFMIFRINGLKPISFISLSVCSAILAITHIATSIIILIKQNNLEDELPFGSDFYDVLLAPVKSHELVMGLIFLGSFAVMLTLGIIGKKFRGKKFLTPKANEPTEV